MVYRSKAAARRGRRRMELRKRRNAAIRFVGIVVFGVLGIVIGLGLVKWLMPDHRIFEMF